MVMPDVLRRLEDSVTWIDELEAKSVPVWVRMVLRGVTSVWVLVIYYRVSRRPIPSSGPESSWAGSWVSSRTPFGVLYEVRHFKLEGLYGIPWDSLSQEGMHVYEVRASAWCNRKPTTYWLTRRWRFGVMQRGCSLGLINSGSKPLLRGW